MALEDALEAISEVLRRLSEQPGALRLTGILVVAAALYLWWSLSPPARPKRRGGGAGGGGAAAPTATSTTAPQPPPPPTRPPPPPPASKLVDPSVLAARAALRGASTVSVSCPGVLLNECEGGGLESGATPRPDAVRSLRALSLAARGGVYLVCRVVGDVGEASARGALEAAGAVGPPPAPVPPQRLLFCETSGGKVAAVRALEPGLHVDAEPGTLEALSRFVPRLALVSSPQSSLGASIAGREGGGGGGCSSSAAEAAEAATAEAATENGSSSHQKATSQLGDGRWPSAPSLSALLGLPG